MCISTLWPVGVRTSTAPHYEVSDVSPRFHLSQPNILYHFLTLALMLNMLRIACHSFVYFIPSASVLSALLRSPKTFPTYCLSRRVSVSFLIFSWRDDMQELPRLN